MSTILVILKLSGSLPKKKRLLHTLLSSKDSNFFGNILQKGHQALVILGVSISAIFRARLGPGISARMENRVGIGL
jgi:hypothetical protein